jgi:AcrR family transcriptional regulator
MKEAKRPRGRPPVGSDEERRQAILDLALKIFVEQGYVATTMDELAAKGHWSKQTLYRLFPSKVALFEALADRHRQSMLDFGAIADEDPVDIALAKIFRVDLTEAEDLSRRSILQLAGAERGMAPELATAIRSCGYEPSRARLAQWLESRRARGELVFEEEALEYAGILMAMMFVAPGLPSDPSVPPFNPDRYRAHVKRCIAVFLGGVGSPGLHSAPPR